MANPKPTQRTAGTDISEWTRGNFKKSMRVMIRRTGKPAHEIMADMIMKQDGPRNADGDLCEVDTDRFFQMLTLMTKFLPRESVVHGKHEVEHKVADEAVMEETERRLRAALERFQEMGDDATNGANGSALPDLSDLESPRH